jgi:DNA-directed RNA polymerase III subunit RPC8
LLLISPRALDGRWMLKTEDGDELYLDLDDEIRFLVSSIKYPPIPVEQKETDRAFAPMQIIVCLENYAQLFEFWLSVL